MLSPEENAYLTRTGPGTPMGELFRRFWLPLFLSSELPENDGPPMRTRILNEDLVGYRDTNGHVGVLDAYCPHRRAPLFYGRTEECGLRCVYHGWKFDASGTCVDMPSEPPESDFKDRLTHQGLSDLRSAAAWSGSIWGRQTSNPSVRRSSSGPSYPPRAGACVKWFHENNFMQGIEGDIDTAHVNFLHMDYRRDSRPARTALRQASALFRVAEKHPAPDGHGHRLRHGLRRPAPAARRAVLLARHPVAAAELLADSRARAAAAVRRGSRSTTSTARATRSASARTRTWTWTRTSALALGQAAAVHAQGRHDHRHDDPVRHQGQPVRDRSGHAEGRPLHGHLVDRHAGQGDDRGHDAHRRPQPGAPGQQRHRRDRRPPPPAEARARPGARHRAGRRDAPRAVPRPPAGPDRRRARLRPPARAARQRIKVPVATY